MVNITGKRIREMRIERGVTQSELAETLDKTCGAPRMWELGKSMPDAAAIRKLSAFFGCSSDYLLGISDFKSENERMAFVDTERLFYESLGNLRGRDKMRLVAGLHRYICAFVAVEDETGVGFEHLSALIGALTGMLAGIDAARERRAARHADGAEKEDTEKICALNIQGITEMGRQKLIAHTALEEMQRKLLVIYLDIINGSCCHDTETEEE